MLTTETCPLFLGSVQRHKSLPAFQEGNVPPPLPVCLLLRQCLPAPSPQNSLFSPIRGEKQPEHSSGSEGCHGQGRRRGARSPSTKRMHRGKGREAGPEKSGSHRKRSLDEISGSFQPRGAGQELSLAPRTSSPAAKVPHGPTEPHGAQRHPPHVPAGNASRAPQTRGCPAKPQTSATSAPLPPPSSSSSHAAPPRFQSLLPRRLFGGAREAQPRDADPKTHSGGLERQQAQPAPAESRAGLPARWGCLPGQKRERKAPFE